MSDELKGLDGQQSGYKKDGRGAWADNGEATKRYSMDKKDDKTLNEHTVEIDKKTGHKHIVSSTHKKDEQGKWKTVESSESFTPPEKNVFQKKEKTFENKKEGKGRKI